MRGHINDNRFLKAIIGRRAKLKLITYISMLSFASLGAVEIIAFRSNKFNSRIWRVAYDIYTPIKQGGGFPQGERAGTLTGGQVPKANELPPEG